MAGQALPGAVDPPGPGGAQGGVGGGRPAPARPPRGCCGGRVTLFAASRQGWAPLCRLVSAAHAASGAAAAGPGDDRAGAPAVTQALIAEHAAGLVVLLGPASDVGRAVAARRRDEAGRALARWRQHAEVAVEIVDHLEPHSTFRAARLAELAAGAGVPAVLTNAVRYLDP